MLKVGRFTVFCPWYLLTCAYVVFTPSTLAEETFLQVEVRVKRATAAKVPIASLELPSCALF